MMGQIRRKHEIPIVLSLLSKLDEPKTVKNKILEGICKLNEAIRKLLCDLSTNCRLALNVSAGQMLSI